MKPMIVLIIALLTGCQAFKGTRAGVYYDFQKNDVGSPVVFRLDVPLYKKGNVGVWYAHQCKVMNGAPFNNERETTYDMIGVVYTFE